MAFALSNFLMVDISTRAAIGEAKIKAVELLADGCYGGVVEKAGDGTEHENLPPTMTIYSREEWDPSLKARMTRVNLGSQGVKQARGNQNCHHLKPTHSRTVGQLLSVGAQKPRSPLSQISQRGSDNTQKILI